MALKSEQARVLRRRVLGGLIRNLLLFSGAFALACLAIETFMVPSIANWVADSTSSWRTLNSSEQFQQILTDQGLLDDAILFDLWVNEAIEGGYTNDAGTITEIQGEVNEMEDALAEYASMMADSPENAEAAAAHAKERAEKLGADVAVASGTNAAAIGDASTFIDDATALDAETDSAPADKTARAVPLLPYQTILTAEAIPTDDASAAQAIAALRVSASLQELGLSLPEAQTFMPPETTVDAATRILVSAAVLGYDQPTLNDLLQSAFRQSQEQAYSAWLDLTSAEEARALGVSDENPVWQIQYGEDGVYRIRDVATYTFVKSFKLPLALLVFVAGWLAIILRALNRSLRYFDELSGAVGSLLADKDAPIELPADLSIARNELAVIRSQSLADERAAHAAEQRKNELVAYLAHDIRTPLTSVLGYLDLLRETTDLPRETLRKYADIAYSKAERLESLINEFFEITRYNLSAIPIERETVGCACSASRWPRRSSRRPPPATSASPWTPPARASSSLIRTSSPGRWATCCATPWPTPTRTPSSPSPRARTPARPPSPWPTAAARYPTPIWRPSSRSSTAKTGRAPRRRAARGWGSPSPGKSSWHTTATSRRRASGASPCSPCAFPPRGRRSKGQPPRRASRARLRASSGWLRPCRPAPCDRQAREQLPRRLPQRRVAGPPPVRFHNAPSANGRKRRAKVPLR